VKIALPAAFKANAPHPIAIIAAKHAAPHRHHRSVAATLAVAHDARDAMRRRLR
jgi:hypothetical protein